jgi:hypothetical protein
MTLPPIFTAALHIACHRCQLELALVSALLCDPAAGVAHARRHGVGEDVFSQDDTRIIFQACDGRDLSVDAGYAAMQGLMAAGLWDPQSPRHCRGMRWSLPSLAALATQFHRGPCTVQRWQIEDICKKLLLVHGQLRDSAAYLERAGVLVGMLPLETHWHPVAAAQETIRVSRLSGIPVRILLEHITKKHMEIREVAA